MDKEFMRSIPDSREFVQSMISFLTDNNLIPNESVRRNQIYTLQHKYAFLQTTLFLNTTLGDSRFDHDTDKLVLYALLGVRNGGKMHRKYSRHHIQNLKNFYDYEDCVIDYECARLTKPDKPLNAYNTIMKYYPERMQDMSDTLTRLGVNSPENRVLYVTALKPWMVQELQSRITSYVTKMISMIQFMGVEETLIHINGQENYKF